MIVFQFVSKTKQNKKANKQRSRRGGGGGGGGRAGGAEKEKENSTTGFSENTHRSKQRIHCKRLLLLPQIPSPSSASSFSFPTLHPSLLSMLMKVRHFYLHLQRNIGNCPCSKLARTWMCWNPFDNLIILLLFLFCLQQGLLGLFLSSLEFFSCL